MSAIVTDDYKKSMIRVYSDSERKSEQASTENTTFNSLLKSLESNKIAADNTKFDNHSGTEPKVKTEVSEAHRFIVPKPQIFSEVIGDMPIEEENTFDISANEVLPQPDPTKQEPLMAIPQIPQVVSAERIDPNIVVNETSNISFMIKQDMDKHGKIKDMIVEAGKFYGIDPSLGLAIARVESAFNPKAISKDGFSSKGLFQLLDSTGKEVHENSGISQPYKPFDPSMNTFLGMGHFRKLLDIFSKDSQLTSSIKAHGAHSADDLEKLAVAAYNAGEGNVARAQAKALQNGLDPGVFNNIKKFLPEITKSYVDKVGSLRLEFAQYISSNEIA